MTNVTVAVVLQVAGDGGSDGGGSEGGSECEGVVVRAV